jgi:6-phosphogluconolactonase
VTFSNQTAAVRRGAFGSAISILVVIAGLVACGGGGGGGGGGGAPPPTYTIGGTVTSLATGEQLTLENNAGDPLTLTADGGFAFSKAVTMNGSYSVTVSVQPPGQSCAVSAASGSNVSANVSNISVVCSNLAQYAYVVNHGSNTLSQYSISSAGTLTPLAVPTIATGGLPESVTIDHTHHTLYVTNFSDNSVSQYAIQADGMLAPLSPSTVATGSGPWALAVSGQYAIVVNSNDLTLSTFMIGTDGALSALPLIPASTGGEPWAVTVSPNGKSVYVSSHTMADVWQYSLAGDGTVTALSPVSVPSGGFPAGITVDANSAFAYVSNVADNNVSQYAIGSDGTLTSLTPATVNAGSQALYIAIDPSNKYAYVANYVFPDAVGSVSQYALGANGALTPLTPAIIPVGSAAVSHPYWIAFDPFGRFAYVVDDANNNIAQFSIGATGQLTPLATATVPTGSAPFAIATTY